MSLIGNPSGREPLLENVAGFDMRVERAPWPFAEERAGEIARHWRESAKAGCGLFDGRVLVARDLAVRDGVLTGRWVEASYSALLYWRSLGFTQAAGAYNGFGAPVVVTRDGAVLLGVMGAHNATGGNIYFPCGTPDLEDVRGGVLDLEGSMLRELHEETGLDQASLRPAGRRWLVRDAGLACCARLIEVDCDADALERKVRAHLAAQARPELSDIVMVRRMSEADPLRVPAYARRLLAEILQP